MRALRQSGKHWHRGLTGAPHPTHRARPQWRSMQSFMRTLTGYAQRAQISPGRCANCWCTSAALTVSTLATRCVQAGTPAGDFHPMSSRPCGADQKKAHPGERVGLEALRKKDVVGTGGGSLPCSRYFCSSPGGSNLASWPAEQASCCSNEKHFRGRPRQRPSPV